MIIIRMPIVPSLAKACDIQRASSGMCDGAGIRGIVFTALFTAIVLVGSTVFSGPPVAPTEPLSPQEQIKKFKLPPGFSIQLVASEPQIQKPMNLAFDARGRLWVTHSIEYPFAAKPGTKPQDGLTVLEGIGADGRATKATRFADELNIPIGVLPLGEGHEAIVWSIPYIWKLSDTDRDGVADKREILYGPFDFVDTHGNQNAFRMGLDGWVYACHGFRNNSQIKLRGEGDVVLTMNSGNTYRFRPDGSAIEQVSWGQVNPFGSCFDPLGNFFTADCHSRPLTMVLRGGYYDSFGKPHDGLGFAPITTSDDHGSTGIAGVAYYDAHQFPPEYRDCLYLGNVVTNVVHRDRPEWRGSSPWVQKPEDFITCDDWWFHPVDVQLGPDGALYISDFYNCIIGHYEVDLNHPRRDRDRGRVWRVVWSGDDASPAIVPNLAGRSREELVRDLGDVNLTVRNLATQELARRFGENAIASQDELKTASQRAQAVWLRFRSGHLKASDPARTAVDRLERIHFVRAMGEIDRWDASHGAAVREMLSDSDPTVRRVAADALARHPDLANVKPLLAMSETVDSRDVQLVHAIRIAVRNQLREPSVWDGIVGLELKQAQAAQLLGFALAVPSESAASFCLAYLQKQDVEQEMLNRSLAHAARHIAPARLDEVAQFVLRKYPADFSKQTTLFQSVFDGLTQRGVRLQSGTKVADWAAQVAGRILDVNGSPLASWSNQPVDPASPGNSTSPWGVRNRMATDGMSIPVFDSIVNGEQLTGVFRSAPFTLPKQFTFWMCGHNGEPGTNPQPVNHIRLRLVEEDGKLGETVAREVPPRNDVAREYRWDLARWSGKRGVIEIVDADAGAAYAWIGVGRFTPDVVSGPSEGMPNAATAQALAIRVSEQLQLGKLTPGIRSILHDRSAESATRIAALSALRTLEKESIAERCLTVVKDVEEPVGLRIAAAQMLGAAASKPAQEALIATLPGATQQLERALAMALTATPEGAERLLEAIEKGKATPRLLQDAGVNERLRTVQVRDRDLRLDAILAQLPPADEAIRKLVTQRVAAFPKAKPSIEAGAAIFKKSCVVCHRLGNDGAKVGPQLDGIGQRGHERLMEDILDPNRHIDGAFRATTLTTTNGLVVFGLKLREEGMVVVLADNQGKEVRIPKQEIEDSKLSPLSPMPGNFGEQLPESDLYNLMAFLLQQRSAPSAAP
ncbi:MAG: hypothetical protein RIS70_4284 [Planctomycetota bacterium]